MITLVLFALRLSAWGALAGGFWWGANAFTSPGGDAVAVALVLGGVAAFGLLGALASITEDVRALRPPEMKRLNAFEREIQERERERSL